MDGMVEVELELDNNTVDKLNKIIAQGILGTTVDEVVNHMLRQHIFELENVPKDPEAWRAEYRNKQAAGVKFERLCDDGKWEDEKDNGALFAFIHNKEDYREVEAPKPTIPHLAELTRDLNAGLPVFADPEAWRAEYLAKQAAGVRYENRGALTDWKAGTWQFVADKEQYREVEAPKPTIPHLAERKLWLAQREAGTNEVWQVSNDKGAPDGWFDIGLEPEWRANCSYRVKPKTVTYFMVMLRYNKQGVYGTQKFDSLEDVNNYATRYNCTIIGNIETREVEA